MKAKEPLINEADDGVERRSCRSGKSTRVPSAWRVKATLIPEAGGQAGSVVRAVRALRGGEMAPRTCCQVLVRLGCDRDAHRHRLQRCRHCRRFPEGSWTACPRTFREGLGGVKIAVPQHIARGKRRDWRPPGCHAELGGSRLACFGGALRHRGRATLKIGPDWLGVCSATAAGTCRSALKS
jgi:hypothetical protein